VSENIGAIGLQVGSVLTGMPWIGDSQAWALCPGTGEGQQMGKRVLLIEDEPHIVEAIRFILARDGWSVAVHGDGTDALAVIIREVPDVLVLDVMLPGRSGYEILTDLRADPKWADLPVLVLSARGQSREREAAERAGATRFMSKPFGNAEIIAALHDMAGA
jgi:DNA-binding response OmpR family regulator